MSKATRSPGRRGRQDDGITIILVALLAVALLLVAALAIDGGVAYANRRQMQNAADAAAMAGTGVIDDLRFGTETDGGKIWDAIDDARDGNHATSMTCYLTGPVTSPGVPPAVLTPDVCSSRGAMVSAWNGLNPNSVAGVKTEQTGVKETYLAKVAGFETVTAHGQATATIQPYLGGGAAPFIICGNRLDDLQAYDMLNPDGTFKPSAFVTYGPGGSKAPFNLQGGGQAQNGGVPGCGLGSSFDGKLDQGVNTVRIGVPAKAQQGNGFNSAIRNAVVSSQLTPCPPTGPFNGCGMLIPIAGPSNGGNGNNMWITPLAWGVFKVYGDGHGNPKYSAELIANATLVDGGIGGVGNVVDGQLRLIKLVD